MEEELACRDELLASEQLDRYDAKPAKRFHSMACIPLGCLR